MNKNDDIEYKDNLNKNKPEVVEQLPLFSITPDKDQARKSFNKAELEDLAQSIAKNGVIVPIIVKPLANNKYQIIAGERRWRAAIIAKLETIPAIVREDNEFTNQIQSLLENIQRSNLNPIEEAHAYRDIIAKYGLTQDELAKQVGKSRATITNSLRLLKLPEQVQELLLDNKITPGHAKVILSLNTKADMNELANRVIAENLSVRATENLVQKYVHYDGSENSDTVTHLENKKVGAQINQAKKKIEDDLRSRLATKVELNVKNNNSGSINIEFYSLEDLERLLDLLK